MEYDDFEIDFVTIELRYAPAFPLWDRSGEVWTRFLVRYPDFHYQTASPTQQIFEAAGLRATVELEKFSVQARGVDAQRDVADVAQSLLIICSEQLSLSIFTRLGYRDIRVRKFEGLDEAVTAAGDALSLPFKESLIAPNKVLNFTSGVKQEGEKSGLGAYIKAEEREYKLSIPWEASDRLKYESKKEYVLALDSDYYTVGVTPRSALDLEEWARQANRSIKKYWKAVLP